MTPGSFSALVGALHLHQLFTLTHIPSLLLWEKSEHLLTDCSQIDSVLLPLLRAFCRHTLYIFPPFLALGKTQSCEHPAEMNPAARLSFGLSFGVISLVARCPVFSLCICWQFNLSLPVMSALNCKILQSVVLDISVISTSATILIISSLLCTSAVVAEQKRKQPEEWV